MRCNPNARDAWPRRLAAWGLAWLLCAGLARGAPGDAQHGAKAPEIDAEMTLRRLRELKADSQGNPERTLLLQMIDNLARALPIQLGTLPRDEQGDLFRADVFFLSRQPAKARQAYLEFLNHWLKSPMSGYARYQVALLLEPSASSTLRDSLLGAIEPNARPAGLRSFAELVALESRQEEPAESRLKTLESLQLEPSDSALLRRFETVRGRLLYDVGRYPEAWAAFRRAEPVPMAILGEMAEAGFLAEVEPAQVESLYDQMIKRQLLGGKFDSHALLRKAMLCEREGRFLQAAELYGRIVAQKPSVPEADQGLLRLALLMRAQNVVLPSMARFAKFPSDPLELLREAALLSEPVGLQGKLEYARALVQEGRGPEAVPFYRAALASPLAVESLGEQQARQAAEEYRRLTGQVLAGMERTPQAIVEYWTRYGEAFGTSQKLLVADAMLQLGLYHGASRIYGEALGAAAPAEALAPEARRTAEAAWSLARAGSGDFSFLAARLDAGWGSAHEPDSALLGLLLDAGRCELALRLSGAIRRKPAEPEGLLRFAECLFEAGRAREALSALGGWRPPADQKLALSRRLGDLLLEQGLVALALEAYRKADPGGTDEECVHRQAVCLLKLGRVEELRRLLERNTPGSAKDLLSDLRLEARYEKLASGAWLEERRNEP